MQKIKLPNRFKKPLILALLVVLSGGFVVTPMVGADRFEEQIRALQAQNAENQAQKQQLRMQAETYEAAIAALQSQINGLEAQIRENQEKNNKLQAEINEAEAELARQKNLLGQNIRAMYLEGDISTLEMLASSKDLSEFVDKQQYRNSVKDKIRDTLAKVTELKAKLQDQKAEVERLINEQQTLKAQVVSQRSEQNRLLSMNRSQQAAYEGQVRSNNTKIAELRRQQAIENARLFGSTPGTGINCGGGYPGSASGPWGRWGCDYPLDYNIDPWGMYNRQCVSYTAFKVHQDYRMGRKSRDMPYWGGIGNANQWDDNARAANIPVDRSPRVGDVAVSNSGTYGHVMYVEAVGGDGSIYISDYNQQWDGRYREYWISASTVQSRNLVFIHFP